ncbi:MAG: EFR1 family ferrodoxin, partial [Bacteroidaceae bacterium]|nr:EFR1 family ferrodoxin [Bacteroidaceae bacterium]
MIYYFSGTGNSLYVAEHIADALGEELCPMTSPVTTDDSVIGLVFPVYAWGIPNVVERFVRKHRDSCLAAGAKKGGYIYAVMTCGDDMGYADRVLESVLGRELDAAFSVLMPDVYICLPGFDVDSEEECREKFSMEKKTVKDIVA